MSVMCSLNLCSSSPQKPPSKADTTLQCFCSRVCGFETEWAWHQEDTGRIQRFSRAPGSISVQHGRPGVGGNTGAEEGPVKARAPSGWPAQNRPQRAPERWRAPSRLPQRAAQDRYSWTASSFRVKPRRAGFRSWLSSSLFCRDTKSLPSR